MPINVRGAGSPSGFAFVRFLRASLHAIGIDPVPQNGSTTRQPASLNRSTRWRQCEGDLGQPTRKSVGCASASIVGYGRWQDDCPRSISFHGGYLSGLNISVGGPSNFVSPIQSFTVNSSTQTVDDPLDLGTFIEGTLPPIICLDVTASGAGVKMPPGGGSLVAKQLFIITNNGGGGPQPITDADNNALGTLGDNMTCCLQYDPGNTQLPGNNWRCLWHCSNRLS